MRFRATELSGAVLVETDKHEDDRGFFSRLRCSQEFQANGLPGTFVQTNLSFNHRRGTFRGMHFQAAPSTEGKLVRCVSGLIRDVIVDLRPDSPSYLSHQWFELSMSNCAALWVPHGFAHGFLTGVDDTTVLYEMTDFFAPDLARGARWDDPAFNIAMPDAVEVIHPRDATYADLDLDGLSDDLGNERV